MSKQETIPKEVKEKFVAEEAKEIKATEAKIKVKAEEAKEKKKPIRRAMIEPQGRLHIDSSKKRQDVVYRFVNDIPGKVDYARQLGYEFCDDSLNIGDGTVDETSLGRAIEVGKYKGSVKSYLMACPKDIYDERQKVKREANEAALKSTIKANQRKDQQEELLCP